jgi:hypothetical protein
MCYRLDNRGGGSPICSFYPYNFRNNLQRERQCGLRMPGLAMSCGLDIHSGHRPCLTAAQRRQRAGQYATHPASCRGSGTLGATGLSYVSTAMTHRFSIKGSIFWDITPCSPLKSTDVSEEHVTSIFRVEE